MTFLNRVSIRWKISAIVALATLAFIAYGVASYRTIMALRINGELYRDIAQGKDLIADVLPPPEYIIESYLTAQQLGWERDTAVARKLRNRLQRLEEQYGERHEVWLKTLHEGALKSAVTDKAYRPALLFYAGVRQDFLPALDAGNYVRAQAVLRTSLTRDYEEHRAAIDEVVRLAQARCRDDEASASALTRAYFLRFAVFGALVLGGLLLVSFRIARSIVGPIGRSILYVRSLADRGDADAGIEHLEVTAKDEIGELFTEFNRFIDRIHDDIAACAGAITEATGKQAELAEKMSNTILENDIQTNTGI